MMDGMTLDTGLNDAVQRYCAALHFCDGAALEALCDARFLMHWVGKNDIAQAIDKAAFTARVGARAAFPGEPVFEVLSVDVDGNIAQVKLNVTVPPRVYTDQLGFFRVGDEWRLVTKLFRVSSGPAMEV
ncbi:MAG: putative lumazine-binding [Cypionkella sp.]|uniref:nuclear transport factor 2 family protein n=1 Tax=Cypionkella sp. TaxID=2811411 RepID=UPI0026053CC7|nr:nuclear transport factor 2 family protein [Cypionkella sp.]MDB5657807.1 putative lumazine-binding [Cypionkella sp.]